MPQEKHSTGQSLAPWEAQAGFGEGGPGSCLWLLWYLFAPKSSLCCPSRVLKRLFLTGPGNLLLFAWLFRLSQSTVKVKTGVNFKQTQLHVCIGVAVIPVLVVFPLALFLPLKLLGGTSGVHHHQLLCSFWWVFIRHDGKKWSFCSGFTGVCSAPEDPAAFTTVAETAAGTCCAYLLPEIVLYFSPFKLWSVFLKNQTRSLLFLCWLWGRTAEGAVVLLTTLPYSCASVELFRGNQTLRKGSYLFCRQRFLPQITEVIPPLLATSP